MKLVAATLSLILLISPTLAEEIPTEPAYLYWAVVTNVVDGDTVDADVDLGFFVTMKNQRLRLVGIDTPETKGPTRPAGEEASEFLRSMIDGETVLLRTIKDKDGDDRDDSFGRWLVTIYIDGVNVNAAMIDNGHAVPYRTERGEYVPP
jgi:micrococcal nuclease